jgi:ABC-type multidrug transport system ATPase subunit
MQEVVAVSVKNLTYTYKAPTTFSSTLLDDISFSDSKGDLLGVIGPNGAGNSTRYGCMLGRNKNHRLIIITQCLLGGIIMDSQYHRIKMQQRDCQTES